MIPGYASLPACSLGKRLIDRKQALLMSHCLHWPIIACNRALLAPSALRSSNGLLLTTARWKRCVPRARFPNLCAKPPYNRASDQESEARLQWRY